MPLTWPVVWAKSSVGHDRTGQWLLSLGSFNLMLLVGRGPGDSVTLGTRQLGAARR